MTSPIPSLPRPRPPRTALEGRYCRVEPVTPDHFADLWEAYDADADGRTSEEPPPAEAGYVVVHGSASSRVMAAGPGEITTAPQN